MTFFSALGIWILKFETCNFINIWFNPVFIVESL